MTAWRENKEADIAKLRSNLDDLARDRSNLISGLTESELEEALTEIKFEIDLGENVKDLGDLLETVFTAVADQAGVTVLPEIPEWFVRHDDVMLVDKFDQGSFGFVLKGKGCHVGKPYFFVSEYAENSNFSNFFHCADNKSKVWQLFLQAAQGLVYLHGQGIVHSEIKCANLLVSGDGSTKVSDFGFSHLRTLSVDISIKELPSSTRWKVPECLLEQGGGAKSSFESDMYAFAMSIIEAKIDGLPWGEMSDDDILDRLATGEGYPRPKEIFTDKEWSLAQAMTAFEPKGRITLEEAVGLLQELAKSRGVKRQWSLRKTRSSAQKSKNLVRSHQPLRAQTVPRITQRRTNSAVSVVFIYN